MAEALKYGTKILPIDSEHNAIFRCLTKRNGHLFAGLFLPLREGHFLDGAKAELSNATPEQARGSSNWDMGAKISVDSASMMNKALEVIEAHVLFGLPPAQIDVIIHPQSVIHSMVEYTDGSVLAQMGASDMRTLLLTLCLAGPYGNTWRAA